MAQHDFCVPVPHCLSVTRFRAGPEVRSPIMNPSGDPAAPRIELVPVDEDILEALVAVAIADADPDDVTPPLKEGWGPARVAWLRDFHQRCRPARRAATSSWRQATCPRWPHFDAPGPCSSRDRAPRCPPSSTWGGETLCRASTVCSPTHACNRIWTMVHRKALPA